MRMGFGGGCWVVSVLVSFEMGIMRKVVYVLCLVLLARMCVWNVSSKCPEVKRTMRSSRRMEITNNG